MAKSAKDIVCMCMLLYVLLMIDQRVMTLGPTSPIHLHQPALLLSSFYPFDGDNSSPTLLALPP